MLRVSQKIAQCCPAEMLCKIHVKIHFKVVTVIKRKKVDCVNNIIDIRKYV